GVAALDAVKVAFYIHGIAASQALGDLCDAPLLDGDRFSEGYGHGRTVAAYDDFVGSSIVVHGTASLGFGGVRDAAQRIVQRVPGQRRAFDAHREFLDAG